MFKEKATKTEAFDGHVDHAQEGVKAQEYVAGLRPDYIQQMRAQTAVNSGGATGRTGKKDINCDDLVALCSYFKEDKDSEELKNGISKLFRNRNIIIFFCKSIIILV